MPNYLILILTLILIFTTSPTLATHLGLPDVVGDGCDKNSVGVALSPDGSALSILFDKFSVEVSSPNSFARKNCRILIPIDLDADETVSIYQMEYRGYNFLPERAMSTMMIDSWFAEKEGPGTKMNFKGVLDSEYRVVDSVQNIKKQWAPCGRPVRLHIQAGLVLRTNNKGDQAMISIDTLDVTKGLVYKFERRKCKKEFNERWDNPKRKEMEDRREKERERERDEKFKKKPN